MQVLNALVIMWATRTLSSGREITWIKQRGKNNLESRLFSNHVNQQPFSHIPLGLALRYEMPVNEADSGDREI